MNPPPVIPVTLPIIQAGPRFSAIPPDILQIILAHTPPPSLLMLGMTCKTFNAIMDNTDFWTSVISYAADCYDVSVSRSPAYNVYEHMSKTAGQLFVKAYRRPVRELEQLPPLCCLTRNNKARHFSAIMFLQGCQNCGDKRARKVYMPFQRRLCAYCYHKVSIDWDLIPAAAGYECFHAIEDAGIDLSELPVRAINVINSLGAHYHRSVLRSDLENLFQYNFPERGFDYTEMDKRIGNIDRTKQRLKAARHRSVRVKLAKRLLGVAQLDLTKSPALKAFIQNGPHNSKYVPPEIAMKIHREITQGPV